VYGFLLWPLGLALMLSFAFPHVSQGASLASLSGIVYVDLDKDGTLQDGDWGVRCALVQLYDVKNKLVQQLYTDSQGRYTFSNLESGTYTVRDATPSSRGTTPSIGQIIDGNKLVSTDEGIPNSSLVQISNISLTAGNAAQNYNFGNEQYPGQLYSKRLLLFSTRLVPTTPDPVPVPEPVMILQLGIVGCMICGWSIWRRRFRMS
jgi:hypothetical protein